MGDLAGKVVVLTGASSGIGRETARLLARAGAKLALAARRDEALEAVAAECRSFGAECAAVPTDVTNADEVDALARAAVERFGGIDAWVNNAGAYVVGAVDETPLEVYQRVLEVNYLGAVAGVKAALPHLRLRGGGTIVNVSSIAGRVPGAYLSAYSASKHALRAFSESLREELLGSGISVSTIYPPSVDTPIFQHAANFTRREVRPVGAVMAPERVALAIVRCIERPRRDVVLGTGKLMSVAHTIAPSLFDWLMRLQMDRNNRRAPIGPNRTGNLYSPDPDWTGVEGGWRSRRGRLAKLLAIAALPIAAVGVRGALRR